MGCGMSPRKATHLARRRRVGEDHGPARVRLRYALFRPSNKHANSKKNECRRIDNNAGHDAGQQLMNERFLCLRVVVHESDYADRYTQA